MTTAPLAVLDRVTRRFGASVALDDVSLAIEPGVVLGLLGPNGAGKSTALSLLQGLRRPTSGSVTLFGGDPQDARLRAGLGSTPQQTALPPTLRVGETIDFIGAHFDDRMPTAQLADEFGLTALLRRQNGALSGGQQRRLAVALAFVGRPRLVLLDEPTTGLDVDARRSLWEAVRRQHELGTTVVLTSHYLEEIEALAERVVVLGEGRVLVDDRLDAVLGVVDRRRVQFRTPQPEVLSGLPGIDRRVVDDGLVVVDTADSDALIRELVLRGIPFSDLRVHGASLEEAFLALTAEPSA